jgi:hypothetical protein
LGPEVLEWEVKASDELTQAQLLAIQQIEWHSQGGPKKITMRKDALEMYAKIMGFLAPQEHRVDVRHQVDLGNKLEGARVRLIEAFPAGSYDAEEIHRRITAVFMGESPETVIDVSAILQPKRDES